MQKIDIEKKFSRGEKVHVDWLDACSVAIEWTDKKDYQWTKDVYEHAEVESIGFFYDLDDKGILLTQNETRDSVSHAIFIPIGMIQKMRRLK